MWCVCWNSIRRPKPDPLRLHPPALPPLARALLRRPRLPRHGPAPGAVETTRRPDHHVPDPVTERPLPGQRVCQVCEPVRRPERGRVCGAVARDTVVRARGRLVLARELGGAECGGRERGEGFGGCCERVRDGSAGVGAEAQTGIGDGVIKSTTQLRKHEDVYILDSIALGRKEQTTVHNSNQYCFSSVDRFPTLIVYDMMLCTLAVEELSREVYIQCMSVHRCLGYLWALTHLRPPFLNDPLPIIVTESIEDDTSSTPARSESSPLFSQPAMVTRSRCPRARRVPTST